MQHSMGFAPEIRRIPRHRSQLAHVEKFGARKQSNRLSLSLHSHKTVNRLYASRTDKQSDRSHHSLLRTSFGLHHGQNSTVGPAEVQERRPPHRTADAFSRRSDG